jgi:predicted regulator of Ras-like GTPase activity (Roadblock/LC7/MglB family)
MHMLVKNSKTDDTENETEKLHETLQEIKDQEGIIGYILRGSKSASIDLKDPTKIIDYAVLSSTTFDTAQEMTEALQMGEIDTIIVESEETKLLSMTTNNHRLSIFMEKSVDHNKLYKRLK